jgi:hypothetical protein
LCELILPSREYLVSVGLVTYIPDYLVIGGIINIMQRNGQLNNSETCSEVTRVAADLVNDMLPELIAESYKLKPVKFPEVGRGVYPV